MYQYSSRRSDRRNHLAQEENAKKRSEETLYSKLSKVLVEYGVRETDIPILVQIIENVLNIKIR